MKSIKYKFAIYLLILIATLGCSRNGKPSRVIVLVFDHMRAEYIERFNLPNFKRAKRLGVNFKNGIVGHLESNTIISHPVIQTGKLPRNLPWGTHAMKDVEGYLGDKNKFYTPFGFSTKQWLELHTLNDSKESLIARVKSVNKAPSLAVAQKRYAAVNFGGPYADHIVSLGTSLKKGPFKGYHKITGINVPKYISEPIGNRFYLKAYGDWGSSKELYQFKGNAYLPGNEPGHEGGDIWVGDVVSEFMSHNKDWSVILASFGSIDKVSHVLHEHDKATTKGWAVENGISLKKTLFKADLELGRILDRLKLEGWDKETTIVITADHGGQYSKIFHGDIKPKNYINNLFYGQGENFKMLDKYPRKLKKLIDTNMIEVASLNTSMSLWTKKMNKNQEQNFIDTLIQAPGVAEVWHKGLNKDKVIYKKVFHSDQMSSAQRKWALSQHPKLVNSLASASGPNFIATLIDRNGYDIEGSHGGAQELVQRIPFIVIAPNLNKRNVVDSQFVRLVDINSIIGKILGLSDTKNIDGDYKHILKYLN